jgi:coenzyme PQQ biosynthesis protein C
MTEPITPDELERQLRQIGAERYHNLHPFHQLLHGGKLNRGQVQAWALNRYYYQSRIPMKDAALLSRVEDPAFRRVWRQRLIDHDGDAEGPGPGPDAGGGGIARWLRLTDGLGLDRDLVTTSQGILAETRFAVDAYVRFVRERSLVEAVASSLTEMFAPAIITERVSGMLAGYDFISPETLSYFNARLTQAPRDAAFALDYVKRHARTVAEQQNALAALRFKCDVLWSQLDGLYYAYVTPGFVPPGAFHPKAK